MTSTSTSVLKRALAISIVLHAIFGSVMYGVRPAHVRDEEELIDIEVAPVAPKAEALPAEQARPPDEDLAAKAEQADPAHAATATTATPPDEEVHYAVDAGVDAAIDAAPDAASDAAPDAIVDASVDARRDAGGDAGADATEDAAPMGTSDALADALPADADASEPLVALADAGIADAVGDAEVIAAAGDAGTLGDATLAGTTNGSGEAAAGSGSGAGSGSATSDGSIALEVGSGSGKAGQTDEPAVEGAPTTAGTAANLLTYFPRGHVVTALIRFDRLRGTEWAAQTERLLRPMPDYQVLFGGAANANIVDKLETLVISTPRPRDAAATTLVGRTAMGRAILRDFLGASAKVTWSAMKAGLVGARSGRIIQGDKRVFVSPFKGWFLLAQPADLPNLLVPAPGNLDTVEATGKLPAWLANIRAIESESGGADRKGPALVVTLGLGGERLDLAGNDFGLGITTLPTPDRVSLAMELVKQGWLVRGNMRFASEKDAVEFISVAEGVKERVADSRAIQLVLGKQLVRVVENLSFARTGGRVSYATSISIADARAILAALAQQLDGYFGAKP